MSDPNFHPNSPLVAGRYRVGKLLGKGSYSQVFYAEDTKFAPAKKVALKLINPQLMSDEQVRDDVQREAGIMAQLSHPNILRVIDFEVTPKLAYIITEIAEGGSLGSKLQPDPKQPPKPLPLEEVLPYLEQVASALDEAHSQGLVHRDLKPQNILLSKQGRLLLADFGLSAALSNSSSSTSLIDTNSSGTPAYMAPEQWLGQVGKVSDIYALGVITFQMFTGYVPFTGNVHAISYQHMRVPVPKLAEFVPNLSGIPSMVDVVLAQAMAKDHHKRLRPALEFYRRLKAAVEGGTSRLNLPLLGKTILWVDDMPINNIYIATGLKQLGASIMHVRTTREALAYLKVDSYDLIISDNFRIEEGQRHPKAGYDLLKAVKMDESIAPTPVILYCSNLEKVDQRSYNLAFGITNSTVELRNLIFKAIANKK
jgi:serine/threonine protein kinase